MTRLPPTISTARDRRGGADRRSFKEHVFVVAQAQQRVLDAVRRVGRVAAHVGDDQPEPGHAPQNSARLFRDVPARPGAEVNQHGRAGLGHRGVSAQEVEAFRRVEDVLLFEAPRAALQPVFGVVAHQHEGDQTLRVGLRGL